MKGKRGLTGPINEKSVTIFLFLSPSLAIFITFVALPIVQSSRYSLYNWNGLRPLTDYIGLDNYLSLVKDPVFWKALKHNVILIIASLATQLPLGVFLAILLTDMLRGTTLFRTVYFSPMVLSSVVIGLLWGFVYHPIFGMLNTGLKAIGLGSLAKGWLGDPSLVLPAVIAVICWKYTGFYMVLFMAAIQNIPEELYEAARIDGASGWELTRYITLPLLSGTAKVAAVLSMVGSLKYFDLIWVMTLGGPMHASELVATYMYKQAFQRFDWGYGSALAFSLFLIAFVVAVAFIKTTTRAEMEGTR